MAGRGRRGRARRAVPGRRRGGLGRRAGSRRACRCAGAAAAARGCGGRRSGPRWPGSRPGEPSARCRACLAAPMLSARGSDGRSPAPGRAARRCAARFRVAGGGRRRAAGPARPARPPTSGRAPRSGAGRHRAAGSAAAGASAAGCPGRTAVSAAVRRASPHSQMSARNWRTAMIRTRRYPTVRGATSARRAWASAASQGSRCACRSSKARSVTGGSRLARNRPNEPRWPAIDVTVAGARVAAARAQ